MTTALKETLIGLVRPAREQPPARRTDLDWLRVLAFGLLIFYHIGMLYAANWGYHYKSAYTSQLLENLMLMLNPWRMPLLWLVSGVAIRFILARVTLYRFVGLRSLRLLLPLLFAIVVIVPPQLYWEMTVNGDLSMGYVDFYVAFLVPGNPLFDSYTAGIWPHIDVNHLWYLRELWQFSLLIVLLLPLLRSGAVRRLIDALSRTPAVVLFGIVAAPVLAIELVIDDNRNAIGFAFLLYGYLLGWHEGLWSRLQQARKLMAIMAIVFSLFMIFLYNTVWLGQTAYTPPLFQLAMGVSYGLCRVLWLFAILGYGAVLLKRRGRCLDYLNEAVYPWYILHQSVLIVAAGSLARYQLGPVLEPVLVILITLGFCSIGFELIRRSSLLRPLFGLRQVRSWSAGWRRIGYAIATVLLVPFGLEILF